MRKQKDYVHFNEQEIHVLLKSPIRLKNILVQQSRYTDVIDDQIMKVISAPVKRR